MGLPVLLHKPEGIHHLDFLTNIDTLPTEDTAVHVEVQNDAAGILWNSLLLDRPDRPDSEIKGHIL